MRMKKSLCLRWVPQKQQVWSTTFYMGKFNAATPKRHRLWGNDSSLLEAVACEAGYMSKHEQGLCPGRTSRTYVDGNGVKRCVGIKGALRDSQTLIRIVVISVF